MMLLEKGTKVYLSEVGHYNFFYPDRTKVVILNQDTKAIKKNFLSGNSRVNDTLTAYEIKDIINNTKDNIIVWI
jgi:hypothetical protein